tara:strand:- start:69551 stop:71152 length:1602 start_codon:yes stop_codon:yes gene_type:complete
MAVINLNTRYSFPMANGFGQNATGGRGGYIVEVTNTNFSGTGSLKAALEMTGARTIIFRVGGTISNVGADYLQIPLGSGDVTIAGETAPGDGILIRGARLRVRDSNVIIRHIRFRQDPSNSTGSNDDALTIDGTGGSPLTDIMIDHCSFSWGLDGNLDIRNTWGATVQNCMITGIAKSNLINANSKNVSYLNNIFGLVEQRAIRANTIDHLDLTYEMINNYIYAVPWPGGPSEGLKVTVENNVCERSNSEALGSSNFIYLNAPNPANGENNTIENTYLYVDGNDVGDMYTNELNPSISGSYVFGTPLYRSTYTPKSIVGLKAFLLANCGSGAGISQGLDAVDGALVANINAKTGTLAYSGTFPTISNGTPYTDSNNDGISDSWASTHGITSASQVKATYTINGHTVNNTAGYTALEIFLADMAGDFELLAGEPSNNIPVISLTGASTINLNVGDTYTEFGATATDAEDGNLTGDIVESGTVNTAVAGTYYKYYNVTDSDSNAALQVTRTIIVNDGSTSVTNIKGVNKNIWWSI